MIISLDWLKDYVDLPETVAALDDALTRTGLSVEAIHTKGANFPNVVVAQILESAQHPNADRLSVCRVDDGSGTPRQIVCGAKNYKVGDKVPLAQPGAVLPGDFKIKVGKLRGVESEGMMCSARELALAEDADGLLILPPETKVGTPISEVFPPETVMEIEITPNRGDWLSHVGIARELAAFTGKELRMPSFKMLPTEGGRELSAPSRSEGAKSSLPPSSVANDAPQDCLFYSAVKISGIRVAPSPEWLRKRLESVGLRPINNVVDATNYVMFELGQPLHAFDAAKIDGTIRARHGLPGEKILALDGKEYATEGHVVIADDSQPLALGGIMGGEGSGITDATTDIWLESAVFRPAKIRKSSRELGLASDSSYRYERGVDPRVALAVASRAAQLIVSLAGGTIAAPIAASNELPAAPAPVTLRFDRCREILGTDISDGRIRETLQALGLEELSSSVERVHALATEAPATPENRDHSTVDSRPSTTAVGGTGIAPEGGRELLAPSLSADGQNQQGVKSSLPLSAAFATFRIPSHRLDLTREVDLIEEVARMVGIEAIPSRVAALPATPSEADAIYDFGTRIGQTLSALGFCEARTGTLVSKTMLAGVAETIRLKNPLGADQAYLRPSLMPGLLACIERNLRHGETDLRFYEIGKTYMADDEEEHHTFSLAVTGATAPRSWETPSPAPLTLHDMMGFVAAIAAPACVEFRRIEGDAICAVRAEIIVRGEAKGGAVRGPRDGESPTKPSEAKRSDPKPTRSVINCIGEVGQLRPALAREIGAPSPVFLAELCTYGLAEAVQGKTAFTPIPAFPASLRDIAIVAPATLAYDAIAKEIRAAKQPLLESIELFDIYQDPTGQRLPADAKSLALALAFRAADRTLTTSEVNAATDAIKAHLRTKLGVSFRE